MTMAYHIVMYENIPPIEVGTSRYKFLFYETKDNYFVKKFFLLRLDKKYKLVLVIRFNYIDKHSLVAVSGTELTEIIKLKYFKNFL